MKKLVADGAVSRALARYHVPHFPPFAHQASKRDVKTGSAGGSRPRDLCCGPSDRGLEPQMRRRQRSKKAYAALPRIRSVGTLVVGLDHNNLPFSTAHPEPAGLDYDIAKLLAKKLGVSLEVYWAYSSHDSYPSKLATKKLCDVMLGVMPDDRFGKRVLYSKPYYVATYQLVVAADGDRSAEPAQQVPAGRGASNRELPSVRSASARSSTIPSLEAVLEAVATGRLEAGYVISTAGHWLAEKRWPGKLQFIDPPNPWRSIRYLCCGAQDRCRLEEGNRRCPGRFGLLGTVGRGLRAVAGSLRCVQAASRTIEVRSTMPFNRFRRWAVFLGAVGGCAVLALSVLPWFPARAEDVSGETSAAPTSTGSPPASSAGQSVADRRTDAKAANKATAADEAALAEGQALFRGLCSGCHGGAGRGGKGPNLTDHRWLHGGTDADNRPASSETAYLVRR